MTERVNSTESPVFQKFLDKIDLPRVSEILTPTTPLCFATMGHYGDGISADGGLEVLSGDIRSISEHLGIPMVLVTPFYAKEKTQKIVNFKQEFEYQRISPEDRGFEKVGEVNVYTDGAQATTLGVYEKKFGSVRILSPYEPHLKELYHGANSDDHRLYQEIVNGFGGYRALKEVGLIPPFYHLNEAPMVFMALAKLDETVFKTQDFAKALALVKSQTLYTNHTLVQAVESQFNFEQFKKYVFPNIEMDVVKKYLEEIFKINNPGRDQRSWKLRLSTLIIELSGKANGVSALHAIEASKLYRDSFGNKLNFGHVTNGVDLEKWWPKDLYSLLHQKGILDEFNLPADDYKTRIDQIENQKLIEIHSEGRKVLRKYLRSERVDQYGKPIDIPEGAVIAYWARRMVSYKRPELMFDKPEELAKILKEENIHLIIAGKTHESDAAMLGKLEMILRLVDANFILKERVHYVQNYELNLGKALAQGGDIYINTPESVDEATGIRKSTEASGTSGEKNPLGFQISTSDGHYADSPDNSFLEIKGKNRSEQLVSLYQNLHIAAQLSRNEGKTLELWKMQLKNNLPKYSGARMMKDYLKFIFGS